MSMWNKTLLSLILACSISKNTSASRVATLFTFIGFDTRLTIPNSAIAVGMENTSLYQVKCTHSIPQEIECSLTIVTSSFDNETSWQACEFRVETSEDSRLDPALQIYRFGANKYLASIVEYTPNSVRSVKHVGERDVRAWIFVRFVIIKLPLCVTHESRTAGSSIHLSLKNFLDSLTVQLYQDHFDVIYVYSSNYDLAQESFDTKGVRLHGPIGENNFVTGPDAVTILPWWVALISNSCLRIWSQERIRTAPGLRMEDVPSDFLSRGDFAKRKFRGWSTVNGNVSFCKALEEDESVWRCAQGRSNDSLTFFEHKFDHVPLNSVIYNLPGGGILAMTSSNSGLPFLHASEFSFHLTWIEVARREIDSTSVVLLERQSCTVERILTHFFQNEYGDFCFSLAPLDNVSNFSTKCYSPEIFGYEIPIIVK